MFTMSIGKSQVRCLKYVPRVTGLGAAWLWQGAPGSGFGAEVMQHMQRFLSQDCPRVRIIGGTR